MSRLEPPDTHHLNAAIGWLMLGNPFEARCDFIKISPDSRKHPEVLDFEWRLLARENRWSEAAEVGERLVQAAPEDASAWVHRSYALHELQQTREALERLLPAVKRFPQETIIPYNLACYTCQLGDLVTARCWLDQALSLSGNVAEKIERLQSAVQDNDLKPLWPELNKRIAKLKKAKED